MSRYQEIVDRAEEEIAGDLLKAVTLLLVELRLFRDQLAEGIGTWEVRD